MGTKKGALKSGRRSLPLKRQKRHLRLAALAALCVGTIYFLLGFSPERWLDIDALKISLWTWRLSVSLADTALIFLGVTLVVGPLALLRGRPSPANNYLRRDIAYWAGGLALGHMLLGMTIHTESYKIWTLWLHEYSLSRITFQKGWFGVANFSGLALAGTIALLLLISNDVIMIRLGMRRWKNLQRLAYAALLLVLLHGFAYQQLEQRIWLMRGTFLTVIGLIALLQLTGVFLFLRRRWVTIRRKNNENRAGSGLLP